jgi:hypothetical protein
MGQYTTEPGDDAANVQLPASDRMLQRPDALSARMSGRDALTVEGPSVMRGTWISMSQRPPNVPSRR